MTTSRGTKCLLFSPVRLDPETLNLALRSHRALRAPGFEIDSMYFDDNTDIESSRLLRIDRDAIVVSDVTGLPSVPASDYRSSASHQWDVSNISRVAAIKNKAIEAFLKSDYTHLFLVDSDVILHPDTVKHLLSLTQSAPGVVSEVFWTKWQNENDVWAPQVWDVHPYAHNGVESIIRLREPGTYEVGGLGACTLIARAVMEKIGLGAFTPIPSLNFDGEDRHFCIRASAAGFKLMADTHYPPFHVYRKSQLAEATNWFEAQAPPDYFRTLWLDDEWEKEVRSRARGTGSFPVSLSHNSSKRPTPGAPRAGIAFCLPGQTFSSAYMINTLEIVTHASKTMNCAVFNSYTSNPSATRQMLVKQVLSLPGDLPDYVLWVDDDNIVTPDQLDTLVHDLDTHPELDMVAGWCAISVDTYENPWQKSSCGVFDERGRPIAFPPAQLESESGLVAIDYTGFPCVLMRGSLLATLGAQAFRFINDEVNAPEIGFFGEDISFCKCAIAQGARIAVDTRVKVPHLKLRDSNPGSSKMSLAQAPPEGVGVAR